MVVVVVVVHRSSRSKSSSTHLPIKLSRQPFFNSSHTYSPTHPHDQPLRCLHYIKQTRPRAAFEAALHHLMRAFWAPPNTDLTAAANVARALRGVRKAAADDDDDDDASSPLLLFSADEVDEIMRAAGTDEIKAALKRATQEALDRGAFGAPWLWVTDGEGRAEPFFGSDRFHFVYRFLGLPYRDVTLLPPPSGGGEKSKL